MIFVVLFASQEFAKNLYALRVHNPSGSVVNGDEKLRQTMASSKSFIKANSQIDINVRRLDRYDSVKGSVSETILEDDFGPLSNVR